MLGVSLFNKLKPIIESLKFPAFNFPKKVASYVLVYQVEAKLTFKGWLFTYSSSVPTDKVPWSRILEVTKLPLTMFAFSPVTANENPPKLCLMSVENLALAALSGESTVVLISRVGLKTLLTYFEVVSSSFRDWSRFAVDVRLRAKSDS